MKNKSFLFVLTFLILTTSIYACGRNITEEISNPVDLTGLWVQEDSDASYMAATIDDKSIGVFYILEGDDTPWTYWVGTYTAPTSSKDTYSWTSESTYGGDGLLASDSDTMDFSYKNGKLQCKVSIQGITNDVTFVKGEWDTSNIPDSACSSVNTNMTEFLPLEIRDSAWINSNGYLKFYVTLYNPNTEIAIEFPTFRVTAKDSSNTILGTRDEVCSIIYPQQEFTIGDLAFSIDKEPSSVSFDLVEPEDYNLKNVSLLKTYLPLEAINTAARNNKVVGEIDNKNNYDFDMVAVSVIMRDIDGNVIGIFNTLVKHVASNGTTPFEISPTGFDSSVIYDVYVCPW